MQKTLFDKLFDWATKNAIHKKSDSLGSVYREILGEALKLIPFEEMNPNHIFEIEKTGILTSDEGMSYLKDILAKKEEKICSSTQTDMENYAISTSIEQSNDQKNGEIFEIADPVKPVTKHESAAYLHGSLKNEHKRLEKTDKIETLKLFDKPSTPQILNPLPSTQSPEKKFEQLSKLRKPANHIDKKMQLDNIQAQLDKKRKYLENGAKINTIAPQIEILTGNLRQKLDNYETSLPENLEEQQQAFNGFFCAIEEQLNTLHNNITAAESNIDNATPNNLQDCINALEADEARINAIRSRLSDEQINRNNVDDDKQNEIYELHKAPDAAVERLQNARKNLTDELASAIASDQVDQVRKKTQSTPYSPEKKFDFDISESSGKRKPFNEDFSPPIGRSQRVSYEGPSYHLHSFFEDKW